MSLCEPKFSPIHEHVGSSRAFLWGGAILRPDDGANKNLYGQDISAKDIVFNKAVSVPDSAKNLLATLQKASPTKKVKAVPK